MRYRLTPIIIVVLLAVAPAHARKKEKTPQPKKTPELTWPLAPEKPRIKYIGSLSNNSDVEPPKKKGWLAKMINEEDRPNVIGMVRPASVAVDSKDRIYIADTLKGAVFVFDLANKSMTFVGADGRGKLSNPYGLAIDSKDNIYVSDTKLKQVNIYNAEGDLTGTLRKAKTDQFMNPAGLAIDEPRKRLIIADSRAHKVCAVPLEKLLEGSCFGKPGDEDDQLFFPSFVAVDRSGNIYVSSTMNFAVKVFDSDFKFLRKIGEHGTALGMFDRPEGVALDSEGNLYVVDASFSNFQIFNPGGQLLLFVGAFGQEPGNFRLPSDIFIDRKNRIFVSDQANRRVQMFQFLGGQ